MSAEIWFTCACGFTARETCAEHRATCEQWPPEPTPSRDAIVQAFEAGRAACIAALQRAMRATEGPPRLLPLTADECVTILQHANLYGDLPTAPAVAALTPRDENDCARSADDTRND